MNEFEMESDPTYEQLMAKTRSFITEYDGYLYVKLPAEEYYDNTIWKVNKETKEVSYMMFTEYIIEISERAKFIEGPDWLKQKYEERDRA